MTPVILLAAISLERSAKGTLLPPSSPSRSSQIRPLSISATTKVPGWPGSGSNQTGFWKAIERPWIGRMPTGRATRGISPASPASRGFADLGGSRPRR